MALTKLRGTAQIAIGTIDDSLVSASAAIQTSKLQDNLKFIFADGSRSFTAPVSGVTPTAAAHLATKAYVDGISISFANVTGKPTTLAGYGITDAVSSSVIGAANGIAGLDATGSVSFDGSANATIAVTLANSGVTAGTYNNVTVNAKGLVTAASNVAYLTSSNFVAKETPAGTVDGVNMTFTLANAPIAGTEHLYWNGMLLESGAGNDYTISGATITMLFAVQTGEKLRCSYFK